ncbi:rod shape-determining protein MreD [Thermus scotoductus]|uniref:Rod shape-determining protein MreD n=1 Tax=Thermus scotoductus TaxID=37636 RepID=A0A430V6N2_THESC|nr:rod shape-determining protein MreD [Thermus scotoductus]RTI02580.1 rod shape-determining protein MreD [Thermus scotoductus]RTI20679.1 rod shape-determining protein MreD [Thermus scotoductus]
MIWLLLFLTLFLSGLLGALWPAGLMAPDLFLVLALLYARSLPYYLGLPWAFFLGLVQDLLGYGLLGLHAVGLLSASYAFYAASRRLAPGEAPGVLFAYLWAFLAKWGGYFLVAYWLRLELPPLSLLDLLLEGLFTLPFALLAWRFLSSPRRP